MKKKEMINILEGRIDDLRYNIEEIIKYVYTLTPRAIDNITPKFVEDWRPLKYENSRNQE